MKNRKIEIINSNGENLSAHLELPADKKVKQYVIFAHCFTCSSNLSVVRYITRELTNYGFGVLRFDFTGLGNSGGDFKDTNFSNNLEDIETVNNYLIENYQAPTLLVGHSLGGAAVLIAASKLDNIKAVATIGAPFDTKHVTHLFKNGIDEINTKGKAEVSIGGRPFIMKKQFIDDLEKHSVKSSLARLKKPILILHSPVDKVVSVDNAANIYQHAFHPKSFISLDNADHLLSDKKDSLYAAKTIGTWAERYLLDNEPTVEKVHTKGEQVVAYWSSENNFTTQISNGKHSIIADEPEEVGGDDFGFSPYDLMNAALGACTNMTLKLYANRKGWDLKEVYTYLTHSKKHITDSKQETNKLGRIDHITKKIELHGNLTNEQKERLKEIASLCPVHKSLQKEIVIDTELV
jgi:putative redox protein